MAVQDGMAWEVYALRYGRSEAFPLTDLVAGEAPDVMHPLGWYCWLLRRGNRNVLVDTGVADERVLAHWCVELLAPVPELLAHLGVAPEQVTDIVLTHGHADHTGNVATFPQARIWLRSAEFTWIRSATAPLRDLRWGVSLADYEALLLAASEDRVTLLGPLEEPMAPGVLLCPGGGHTPGSQWVEVTTQFGPLVLASDNAYLHRNIREQHAIGACTSRTQNEAALRQMLQRAGELRRVIPGHDPLVAKWFPEVAPQVYRLDVNGV